MEAAWKEHGRSMEASMEGAWKQHGRSMEASMEGAWKEHGRPVWKLGPTGNDVTTNTTIEARSIQQ